MFFELGLDSLPFLHTNPKQPQNTTLSQRSQPCSWRWLNAMAALLACILFHLQPLLPIEHIAELKGVLLQNSAKYAKLIHTTTDIITGTNNFEGGQDVTTQVAVVPVHPILYPLPLLSDWCRIYGPDGHSFWRSSVTFPLLRQPSHDHFKGSSLCNGSAAVIPLCRPSSLSVAGCGTVCLRIYAHRLYSVNVIHLAICPLSFNILP